MHVETRTTDAKGRLVLPKSFANATVIIEQVSETEFRVRRVKQIPEDELPFAEEAARTLSDHDRDIFLELLANPPAPNKKLKEGARNRRHAGTECEVEQLAKRHERADFECGKPALDDFIRAGVRQYQKRRIGRTVVAVPTNGVRVIGYYTLAVGAVAFEHPPNDVAQKLPKYPVPVILLARLAVDLSCRGQRIGERLLLGAIFRSIVTYTNIGVHAVEVEAIDDEGSAFYRKYGFIPLGDDRLHRYLHVATIEEAIG